MAPSPSRDPGLAPDDAALLLDIAESSLTAALRGERAALPPLGRLPASLSAHVGVFVTLTVAGELNGCIGLVDPIEPLGHTVARLALAAAFDDPRLPALRWADLADLAIEISVMSPLEPLRADTRTALVAAIRPHRDGLVIRAGGHAAVFLPSVWEQLPDREHFVDRLVLKAGLRPGAWPTGMQAFRFTATRSRRDVGAGRLGRATAAR
jgi:AmmeMemoRadiSam system protein A